MRSRWVSAWRLVVVGKLSGLLCLLAGCGINLAIDPGHNIQLDYGMPVPEHDPSVTLVDFTYTPAGPVRIGDKLLLIAHSNKPFNAGYIEALIGSSRQPFAALNDSGHAPDQTAADGVWTGAVQWQELFPQGQDLPVCVELRWYDGTPGQILSGPPLDVEE